MKTKLFSGVSVFVKEKNQENWHLGCRLESELNMPVDLINNRRLCDSRKLLLLDCGLLSHKRVEDLLRFVSKDQRCVLYNVELGSDFESLIYWQQVMGFLYETIEREELCKRIGQATKGKHDIPADLCDQYVLAHRRSPTTPIFLSPLHTEGFSNLSEREKQVLLGIYQGMNNKAIAKTLGVSADTVKSHVYTSFQKIGVTTRLQANRFMAREFSTNLDMAG